MFTSVQKSAFFPLIYSSWTLLDLICSVNTDSLMSQTSEQTLQEGLFWHWPEPEKEEHTTGVQKGSLTDWRCRTEKVVGARGKNPVNSYHLNWTLSGVEKIQMPKIMKCPHSMSSSLTHPSSLNAKSPHYLRLQCFSSLLNHLPISLSWLWTFSVLP